MPGEDIILETYLNTEMNRELSLNQLIERTVQNLTLLPDLKIRKALEVEQNLEYDIS